MYARSLKLSLKVVKDQKYPYLFYFWSLMVYMICMDFSLNEMARALFFKRIFELQFTLCELLPYYMNTNLQLRKVVCLNVQLDLLFTSPTFPHFQTTACLHPAAYRARAAKSCPLPAAKQLILELSCYVSMSSTRWPVPMRMWEHCCCHCPVHNECRCRTTTVQCESAACASCTKETHKETSVSCGPTFSWTAPKFDLIWWTWDLTRFHTLQKLSSQYFFDCSLLH